MKTRFAAGIVALLGLVSICSASPFLELQSSYLGDGWFRYRIKTFNDPFFRTADVGLFALNFFTNRTEYGPEPLNWTNSPTAGDFATWQWDSQAAGTNQVRPYEREFLVRSSEHTYRVTTNFNAMIIMSIRIVSDWNDYWAGRGITTGNIVGYAYLVPCLVPCSPDLADGSPPEAVCTLQIVDHDMVLDSLVVTNGEVKGVTFSAGFKSTVLLEGSEDHNQWTNIAYLWGNAGSTTWTTNISLNDFGRFFRLELVAMDEHVTNVPPLSVGPIASRLSLPVRVAATEVVQDSAPVLTCRLQGDEMITQFVSAPGREYTIEAKDSRSKVVTSRTALGTGKVVAVGFKTADLPTPVFFSARPTP